MQNDRKVSTDALETLGNVIDNTQYRDAIHLAVEPIEAGEPLSPGDNIGIIKGKAMRGKNTLGIVDPFLENPLQKGEWFWMVLYPRTIKSLRHVWTHPAFDNAAIENLHELKALSKRWISAYAKEIGIDFESLMEGTRRWIKNKVHYCAYNSSTEWYDLLEDKTISEEFWEHYENYTGETLSADVKTDFFSCTC